jgi:chemotaxis signal transduction protein
MPNTTCVYAVCQLGGLVFAINADDVVQAIPRPTDTLALPRPTEHDTPVFMLRGQVLPLLDLTHWLPRTQHTGNTRPDKVMVLRCADQWLAVEIDELVGMRRTVVGKVVPVHHGNQPTALFHSVLLPDAEPPGALPLPVLDTRALLQLSGTWGPTCAPDGNRSVDAGDDTATSNNPTQVVAWLAVQNQAVWVETRWLASVEPMPPVQRVSSHNPDVLGITRWRGRDLQVVQLTALLGPRTNGPAPLLAVLTDGERYLGWAVDQARHIENLALDRLQPGQAAGLPEHPGLQGVCYHTDGQRCLVVNAPGLLASAPQWLATASGAQAQDHQAQTDNELPAHIVFQAGPQWALPIDHIEALTTCPNRLDPSHNPHAGLLGSFHWRRQSVPLWDFKQLTLGQATPLAPQTRVVLARHQGRLLGLLVEQLLMLLPARQGTVSTVKRDGEHRMTLITVQHAARAQSFRVLSLAEHLPA